VKGDVAEQLVGTAYRAGWASLRAMPEPLAAKGFRVAADVAFRRRGPGVVQLARNLLRVLGPGATPAELSATVHAGLRSYARYWMETFRLERMDPEEVSRSALATTVGLEHIKRGMEQGRGVILALPHSGNWDVAGVSMVHLYGGFTTVVERLRPESLYRRFVEYREAIGFEVLPLGSPNVSGVLRDRLRAGRMVCLLADRDLSRSGVPVTFFGEPTTMPGGPAMLAALTGADLLPVHMSYLDGGWAQHIGPPVVLPAGRLSDRVRLGTQALADAFAERIARSPADWHMLQPLWSADRGARASGGSR
jgi:KDO2-lipid IV(A) lauroyltransferase